MAGHEAEQEVAGDLRGCPEQVGEVHGLVQILAVGVDVLAQQGDVPVPLGHQAADFVQDDLRLPGALPPTDVGHDAVGAEVVAAVHDAHPRLHPLLAHQGDALGDGAGLVGNVEDAPPAGHQAVEQLREPPEGVGAEDQIHLPVGVLDLLRHVGLLGHAAAHADELAGLGPLGVHQRAQVAQHPLLGVLPDGAGVDDNQVGLRLALGELVPHLAEVAPQPLRVGLVLLAAVGVHKGQGRGRPGGEPLVELLAEIPLAVHVRGGNSGGLSIQAGSSKKSISISKSYHFSCRNTSGNPFSLTETFWEYIIEKTRQEREAGP